MNYDVIVIGSGMGGLTAASILAQFQKKKVLLLERHGKFGGYTHTFSRDGKYTWDVGLHYVGGMKEGLPLRQAMDCVTGGGVDWVQFKDPFQYYIFPGLKISVPTDKSRFIQEIKANFPRETEKIDQYFKDIKKATRWMLIQNLIDQLPNFIQRPLMAFFSSYYPFIQRTTWEHLQSLGLTKEVTAVLDSQWGDYGLPTKQSPFIVHAMVVDHYLYGAYYPRGGSQKISEAVVKIIKDQGGEALVRQEVTEILTEGDRAVGVRCRHTREGNVQDFHAPVIISNAGAYNTYLKMLSKHQFEFQNELKEISNKGTTCLNLYLGLKENPEKIGVQGQNFWIYEGWDHDEFVKPSIKISESIKMGFLSFASQNDPDTKKFTAQLIVPTSFDQFEKWSGTAIRQRGDDYVQLKTEITKQMLDFIERHVPGFGQLVDFVELATPLTFEHYSNHHRGAIYGVPTNMDRMKMKWLSAKTPIHNLYLTGADVAGGGIAGALMGGVLCCSQLMGFKIFGRVFNSKK